MGPQNEFQRKPAISQTRILCSNLFNSLDYGLESVTIIGEDDCYRLIVRNFGISLYNQTFSGINETQQAFLDNFGDRARKEQITPQWTDFYDPNFHLAELTLYIINQHWIYDIE